MFENEKVENDDAGATVFLHKLAIALIQTGAGTGIIKDEVADFIKLCEQKTPGFSHGDECEHNRLDL